MFEIKNAKVDIYSHSHNVCSISAHINDQDYKTLIALGRGKMPTDGNASFIRYDLPNNNTVFLETEVI